LFWGCVLGKAGEEEDQSLSLLQITDDLPLSIGKEKKKKTTGQGMHWNKAM